jgi:hypothetical protein
MPPRTRRRLALSSAGKLTLGAFGLLAIWYGWSLRAPGLKGVIGEVLNPRDTPTAWRYAPLADVEVVVMWFGTPFDNFAHPNSKCLRATSVPTDANGQFEAPGWWRAPSWTPVTDVRAVAYPQAPGLSMPRLPGEMEAIPAPNNFTQLIARGVSQPGVGTGDFDALANYRCPRHAPG